MNKKIHTGLGLLGGAGLVNILAWGVWAWTMTREFNTSSLTLLEFGFVLALSIGLFVPIPIMLAGAVMLVMGVFQKK